MSDKLIGVDVGGTKVSVAVLDGSTLGAPRIRRTDTSDGPHLLDQVVEAIREAGPARAVGVAVPSVVDFATGRVRASVNVPLADIPLRDVLRERLGMPVVVDNDATCAALAEAYDDDGELVARHLVMFTIGTGVGGGIVIGGRVYRGATGAAAELGHTIVGADLRAAPFAHADDFPRPGSLESLAAGTALNELGAGHGIAAGTVVEAARAGDAGALAAIDLLGRRLGIGIANAINTFDPDLVVVGGGVCAAGELLLAPAREEAARFVLHGVGTATRIVQARYGAQAGVRGAALLAGHAMRVAIAVDHAGESLRATVHDALVAEGHEIVDAGWHDDYPNVALAIGRAVASGEAERGVLVCGSGAGVSVAACKLPGIRAAVCHDHYTAAQCVTHDDCNVLCLGARVIGPAVAAELAQAFAGATFSGEERHVRRLAKISIMERDGLEAKL
jgi:glucokinase